MKKILTTIAGIAALSASFLLTPGCATSGTPEQHAQTCATAQAAYAAYQAVLAASDKPSKDQILAAAAAGAFLQVQCGWTTPPTKARGPIADANGVLILTPPK